MSVVARIESGVIPAELREALRTLISQNEAPYLDLPGTSDGPGICISTSLADFRRHVEMKHQERLDSQPRVPADFRLGGGRKRLPNAPIDSHIADGRSGYVNAATQTQTMSETVPHTASQSRHRPSTPGHAAQTESAPESRTRKIGRASRLVISDSSDVDTDVREGQLAIQKPPLQLISGHSPIESHDPGKREGSSPCAWEKAIRKPVSPIYGPEDMRCGWVSNRSRKRKADFALEPQSIKRFAKVASSRPDVIIETSESDADDENDNDKQEEDEQPMANKSLEDNSVVHEAAPSTSCPGSNPPSSGSPSDTAIQDGDAGKPQYASLAGIVVETGDIVSSTEGIGEHPRRMAVASVPVVPVIPSSQDSVSSQSGSDGQNQAAKVDKDARAALHRIELLTGVQVSQKHRGPMIDHSLALASRDALESFRQACSFWRRDYATKTCQDLRVAGSIVERHHALDRFSHAYYTATDTALRRAVLDVLHRINLAYLYEVYLDVLEELSCFSRQQKAIGSHPSGRARDVFGEEVREIARDQMFWACYPVHAGKARHGIDKAFRATLSNAEKWHMMREEFSIGMLAMIPQGTNNWFEKLPFKDMPLYFCLVRTVNPTAVSMGEMISNRVSASWKGEEPPEQLLRLEHLEAIDDNPFPANPLRLLEEINIGCTLGGGSGPIGMHMGRAVTVPADLNENDAAALGAAFLPCPHPSQGDDYQVPPSSFYDGVEFSAD
jgi:hypothetical protein